MALVTVQRSPTPSTTPESELAESGEDLPDSGTNSRSRRSKAALRKLRKACNTIRFVSKLRLSESYLAVKGAALILPQSECYRRVTKGHHGGDIQSHLQSMFYLLRPQDTIRIAVKLESSSGTNRYLAVVSCIGRQDIEESIILGIDILEETTIGLVLPILTDMTIQLDGDGGFLVTTNDKSHIFKPVSVQAMWSALQSLNRSLEIARTHYYFAGGLNHTWLGYYESRITSQRSALNEWNAMIDLESSKTDTVFVTENDKESFEYQIRTIVKEVMMTVDLEEVTCKQIRTSVEEKMGRGLQEYRKFIDSATISILGQMDSASQIFDYLYLGSEWNASNVEELKNNGVGYILNVTREIDNFFPGMFEYMNIRIFDVEESDLLKWWEKTFKFIRKAKKQGSKCLVHCKMGISRSAATVIAYAMKEYNWNLEQALKYVKEKRSCVHPNKGFLAQLETYQGILDASKQRDSKLWKSKSDHNLSKKKRSALATTRGGGEYLEGTPLYDDLTVTSAARPVSWTPKPDDMDDITMTETTDFANGKSITEQILAAKYADLPQTFKSSPLSFARDVELSSRSADSMDECFPDIPSPMETDPSYEPEEDVELLSFTMFSDSDDVREQPKGGAVELVKGDIWESSSSDASEITAGFYNCLRLRSGEVGISSDSGDVNSDDNNQVAKVVTKSAKILPDGSWIKEVPSSPEVPKTMPTLTESSDQGVAVSISDPDVGYGTPGEQQDKDDVPLNVGIVRKQKHDFEERLKQHHLQSEDRVRCVSGSSEGGSSLSSCVGSSEKINMVSGDSEDETVRGDQPKAISLVEGSELVTESTSDAADISPLKNNEDKDQRGSGLYENENIPLSPGLVKRTTQVLEEITKPQAVITKSPRTARRAESLKEKGAAKSKEEGRRKTIAVGPILIASAKHDQGASSEGVSSPHFRPTPETSPIVSRRKKAKMSLKVDEDGDADEEDEDDPEEDSFLVYNIGEEEVVVKKGKVKRHTMDFEQLQVDMDKILDEPKSDGESQKLSDSCPKQSLEQLPVQGTDQLQPDQEDPTQKSPDVFTNKEGSEEQMEEATEKAKEIEEECPLPRGTVKLHKKAIEYRLSETNMLISPNSPASPKDRSGSSVGNVFNFVQSELDGLPQQMPGSPTKLKPAALGVCSDELPAAGIVRQHKEKIESRNREGTDQEAMEAIDESMRMNQETLSLICRVGESVQNSFRDPAYTTTDNDVFLRRGFVRDIARDIESKKGIVAADVKSSDMMNVLTDTNKKNVGEGSKGMQISCDAGDKVSRKFKSDLTSTGTGSLPDIHKLTAGVDRPVSLNVETTHSADEEEVKFRRHSVVGVPNRARGSGRQRQVKSLVDKFESPGGLPMNVTGPGEASCKAVGSAEYKMDISPEEMQKSCPDDSGEVGAIASSSKLTSQTKVVSAKPPRPPDGADVLDSSGQKIRKHHGKTHPLEKLTLTDASQGNDDSPPQSTV